MLRTSHWVETNTHERQRSASAGFAHALRVPLRRFPLPREAAPRSRAGSRWETRAPARSIPRTSSLADHHDNSPGKRILLGRRLTASAPTDQCAAVHRAGRAQRGGAIG